MSKHVDGEIPWDRDTDCGGRMVPISYKTNWDRVKILFQCIKCWKQHRNKTVPDDNIIELDNLISKYLRKYNL